MGDAKEKIREAAQLALIDLYTEIHGAASNITNNSTTTTTSSTVSNLMNNLLNILDKEVKVNAFGHKGFRGREMVKKKQQKLQLMEE